MRLMMVSGGVPSEKKVRGQHGSRPTIVQLNVLPTTDTPKLVKWIQSSKGKRNMTEASKRFRHSEMPRKVVQVYTERYRIFLKMADETFESREI